MTEPTLFERIIRGDIPASFIDRGDDWVAFLDINPRRPGHTLVVPHQPVGRLAELDPVQRDHLFAALARVQRLLGAHFGTDDFTVVVHDGPAAGQEVPHVHLHVIPRRPGDGGESVLAMFPTSPLPGEVDPDFDGLGALAADIRRAAASLRD